MDIMALAKDGLDIIQHIQPGLEPTAKAITSLTTIGTAAVKVLQSGKKLYIYLIGKRKDKQEKSKEETTIVPETEITIEPKADVAILVDINRRLLRDVARYLDEQKIDANLIIVTNDVTYSEKGQFLNPDDPDEWEKVVQELYTAMSQIKHKIGAVRVHIFLSTPVALAFGLGSVWGTVDEATVYHYEKNTYHPAMKISRQLRQ